jgi:virginiamycin B lyase
MRIGALLLIVAVGACTQGETGVVTADGGTTVVQTTVQQMTSTVATTSTVSASSTTTFAPLRIETFPVPPGSRPHDVAPALDGGIWFTAQGSGHLGYLDPSSGDSIMVPLGAGSRPHGVIVGEQGVAWVTDSGLNAIVSVHPQRHEVTVYPLPDDRPSVNLNTASFDGRGRLWFTGQSGFYGYLNPASGEMGVFDAPHGRGPYGMATAPGGVVWYASLAGSHIARIDPDELAEVAVFIPPTAEQGARRVWPDSRGRIWVSEWNSGNLSRYDPAAEAWDVWRLPGDRPAPYAVYVDETDVVWVSDFTANALVRFDPVGEQFHTLPLPNNPSNVRQILGRPGEVWGAESAADTLVVVRTR